MKQIRDDIIALIGGISLGLWLGITICELTDKKEEKKCKKGLDNCKS